MKYPQALERQIFFFVFCVFFFISSRAYADDSLLNMVNKCTSIPKAVSAKTAEDILYPLSLRFNVVLYVKDGMKKLNRYNCSTCELNGVFTTQLLSEIRDIQKAIGQEATGCITWEFVNYIKSAKL
jgi:hypothetical protein